MLPHLTNIPSQSSISLDRFRGINRQESYEMGELCSSMNTVSDHYPSIASRTKRKKIAKCEGVINGIGSYDGIFYTYTSDDNTKIFLCYKDTGYEFTSYTESEDFAVKRHFAYAGGKILIIPDKVLFDITELKFEKTKLKQSEDYNTSNSKLHSECTNISYSSDYKTRICIVEHNKISSKKEAFTVSGNTKYDFYHVCFNKDIKVNDMIFVRMELYSYNSDGNTAFSACVTKWRNGVWLKVKDVVNTTHKVPVQGYISEHIELAFDDNSIDVAGLSNVEAYSISIEQYMPDLSNIISYNNRIWAIGADKVYTSRLGDADEWYDFSIDNYGTLPASCFTASAGTPGDFTAICQHGNYVYAFKENYIHKIYGDTPDEYSFSNLQAPGCIKNADTISVCGNYLVYASGDGICILRDGYPKIISKKIGEISPICAASYNGKYYLICNHGDGRVIYVYDLEHDIWTMESCGDDADFIYSDARTICYREGGEIVSLSDEGDTDAEDNIRWSFRLRFDRNAFGKNTSIRAVARIDLGEDADFSVKTVYDDGSEGTVCHASFDSYPNGRATLRLPIKRDLGFYLDFEGTGSFTMRSIKFNYYKSFEE